MCLCGCVCVYVMLLLSKNVYFYISTDKNKIRILQLQSHLNINQHHRFLRIFLQKMDLLAIPGIMYNAFYSKFETVEKQKVVCESLTHALTPPNSYSVIIHLRPQTSHFLRPSQTIKFQLPTPHPQSFNHLSFTYTINSHRTSQLPHSRATPDTFSDTCF